MRKWLGLLFMLLLLFGCSNNEPEQIQKESAACTTSCLETTLPQQTEIIQTTVQETIPEPEDDDFVLVNDYIPNIVIDLKYATTDNFTGQIIYDSNEAYLRYGTVKKLILVQEKLNEIGLSLKLWDGYRPPEAQFKLWDICPDGNYVSDPNKGFSSHSRGGTVDITLVDADGKELEMPAGFDDFTAKADRSYDDCSAEAKKNALLLEKLMKEYGFKPYSKEWWHYSDTVSYEVVQDIES